jgi:hypothetical protein
MAFSRCFYSLQRPLSVTIESVQQTLNIAQEAAYVHVLVPVEALIWIRSLAIVLLIVAHALRHVQQEPEQPAPVPISISQPTPLVLTPERVDALRAALAQVTVSEEPKTPQALPEPLDEQRASTAQEAIVACSHQQKINEDKIEHEEENNYERVKAYLAAHPKATDREIAAALTISASTANKWRKRIQAAGGRA